MKGKARSIRGKKAVLAPTMPNSKTEAQWQAEEDVRTLMRAEEIRQNKTRLNKAVAEAKKQAARVSRIAKP